MLKYSGLGFYLVVSSKTNVCESNSQGICKQYNKGCFEISSVGNINKSEEK